MDVAVVDADIVGARAERKSDQLTIDLKDIQSNLSTSSCDESVHLNNQSKNKYEKFQMLSLLTFNLKMIKMRS